MQSVATMNDGEKPECRKRFLGEMTQYRDLLVMLTWRDLKIRYKQSVMGLLWAILMPILIIGSGLLVMVAFSTISGRPINKADVLSIAVKSVPWAFFVAAIRFATNSLVANKELVTKIYFPRAVLPISSVFAALFDFLVAASVVAVICGLARIGTSTHLLWVPVLLVLLVMLTMGLCLFLSCANLFFRDVKYLVEIGLTYGIFFTPIFYSASKLGRWGTFLLLNPLAVVLESINRVVVLHQAPDLGWLGYAGAWAILGSLLAYKIFQKAESAFAENI